MLLPGCAQAFICRALCSQESPLAVLKFSAVSGAQAIRQGLTLCTIQLLKVTMESLNVSTQSRILALHTCGLVGFETQHPTGSPEYKNL